ncbi:MAG TPA: bifunctional response regulator/alkaline phosphatase family protein [Longimicrobiales bacterium]|nr:bifunctional response regulator/alkaline phosphatase family protein [Longimicrobiales bacterium]
MIRSLKRILWVDDEVELFKPHLLFLQQRGYQVDTTTNGDDAMELVRRQPYDLVLLDEQMPGRRGLEVLEMLRREEPHARVVMVTKSEEDRTLTEAIGRRVDDYLVKPASPRQVLSVVTRLLEGPQLRQQQAAQDFARRFGELTQEVKDASGWKDFLRLYAELTDWDIRLHEAKEAGLAQSVDALLADLRREFGDLVTRRYGGWVNGTTADRPPLSTDVVELFLAPRLAQRPLLFVVIDCMRLDQWRVLRPLLAPYFEMDEELYCGILPSATPYARNALFSGRFPDAIAAERPEWWKTEEGSLNAFEDELLSEHLRRIAGEDVPVHYEKVFSDAHADELIGRVRGAIRSKAVVATVFNFVDLLTHGRSESAILMEVARDVQALRALTRQWFERSAAFRLLREAAASGVQVVLTSDHGSILCERPLTVFARKDATTNLRYKFGGDLRAENPSGVFSTDDEKVLRLPGGGMTMRYLLAREDFFFVYPTKLREYQARYRGSFLHGGISPEEMILPVALLTPRKR